MAITMKLLNICIKHECVNIQHKVICRGYHRKFTKKFLRVKKNTPESPSNDNITSKHTENTSITLQSVCSETNKYNIIENIDDHRVGYHEGDNHSTFIVRSSQQPEHTDQTKTQIKQEKRFNQLNLQMLPLNLYCQLFNNSAEQILNSSTLNSLKKDFEKFNININESISWPDVDFQLPPLEGKNLEEHFESIGNAQIKPYVKVIQDLNEGIPEMPKKWIFNTGWTRYTAEGTESVDYPLEEGLVFDVEVCMKEGPLPTLATAVSNKAWYSWVSKSLVEDSLNIGNSDSYLPQMLIPIESCVNENGKKLNKFQKKPKIIIGHNVSYDRARIKEQYWLNCTGTRFLDTMSLHICVSGINSYQRSLLKSDKLKSNNEEWRYVTSLNSLTEVHKLYCGEHVEKGLRDEFVEGSLSTIREKFNDLVMYCATDVVATYNVFKKVYALFQERFPHPVTLAGMLELGSAYLPVNSNWLHYLEEAESTFDDLNYEAKFTLAKRADEVCHLMHDKKYKEDLWMWDQDWSTRDIKMKTVYTKESREAIAKERKEKQEQDKDNSYLSDDEKMEPDPLKEKFEYLNDTKYLLPAKLPHMPGYPAWYRKLCPKEKDEDWWVGPENISTATQVTPKLLNLTWEHYPLHYIKEHGWGFLVPYNDDPNTQTELPIKKLLAQCPLPKIKKEESNVDYAMATLDKVVQNELHKTEFWRYKKQENPTFYKGSGIWCNVDIDNCCWFFKLPHKDGPSYNVGNPLARDFLNKFSENGLAGLDASASQVLKIARMVSYWRNNRNRIQSQMVVWLDDDSIVQKRSKSKMRYGAIIPQMVSAGTLTRRAVESTWMTASNADCERVGSELRAMIQAPTGYNIVGADVDSQELWIASVIGDAYCAKVHGATPFGWMTLIGNKANGTDMHSVTAKAAGISRDHAKIINYARIYGAGQKFAERLLKQFNPSMTDAEAAAKARKMFDLTKGRKMYRLKPEFLDRDLVNKSYSGYEAFKLAKLFGFSLSDMFDKGQWKGGSESAMFNRLEEIANSPSPVTPFLNSKLSRALQGDGKDTEKYLPTKVNWVVQSGAVDFLHLMLVCMRWLMRDNARFCLSFHDEIRYLVPSRYKYNAALALHITNLLTRSFCVQRLGMSDLPMSVAFFASVEVDTVLRKESSHDCKTPSNPYGLSSGYGIPFGESLTVWQAIKKAEGSIGAWHDVKVKKMKAEPSPSTKTCNIMSKATKHKYVAKEVQEDLSIPTDTQKIVQVIESRGNNLHEVMDASGEQFLVSMPTKFRKSIWVMRGNYVLVEPIPEGDKVKAEIVRILTKNHIKFYKSQNCWPAEFDRQQSRTSNYEGNDVDKDEDEDDLFVNRNRLFQNHDTTESESETSSEASDSD